MGPIKVHTARASVVRKGFVLDQGDHERYWYHVLGKKTAWFVKISNGANELKQHEIRGSARVCKMKSLDMFKVLSCDHDAAWVTSHYNSVPG
jgi:hypothetical protein